MKLYQAIIACVFLKTVAGHTVFTNLFVNDNNQGAGTCIRMPKNPATATFPINDVSGPEMACGFNGTKGVSRVCAIKQSSKLSFLFRTHADGSETGSLDPSHKGPCAVYMKRVQSAINDTAVGDGWFKIWDEGYNDTTSQWCTEKLIENNGLLTAVVPTDLAGGYYLIRPELLSLHESDKTPPNPQFYAGCAQVFLDSPATKVVNETVEIPGYVTIDDPALLFNIYEPKFPAPRVGPAPYISGPQSRLAGGSFRQKAQSEGLPTPNSAITNGNWAAVEVKLYTTEDGCWSASEACFDQLTVCYDTAQPTGSMGCKIWEDHCTTIQDGCKKGDFSGPPALVGSTDAEDVSNKQPSLLKRDLPITSAYPPMIPPDVINNFFLSIHTVTATGLTLLQIVSDDDSETNTYASITLSSAPNVVTKVVTTTYKIQSTRSWSTVWPTQTSVSQLTASGSIDRFSTIVAGSSSSLLTNTDAGASTPILDPTTAFTTAEPSSMEASSTQFVINTPLVTNTRMNSLDSTGTTSGFEVTRILVSSVYSSQTVPTAIQSQPTPLDFTVSSLVIVQHPQASLVNPTVPSSTSGADLPMTSTSVQTPEVPSTDGSTTSSDVQFTATDTTLTQVVSTNPSNLPDPDSSSIPDPNSALSLLGYLAQFPPNTPQNISTNVRCGPYWGHTTCRGSPFIGQCCSEMGYCGYTDEHCSVTCLADYGNCKGQTKRVRSWFFAR